jgi:hypothetical protein
MSRIEADHLAREAIVYVRQSTIDQAINKSRAVDANMGWSSGLGSLAGPASASSTTISAARARAPAAQGSKSSWLRSAKAGSAWRCRSRPRAWPATGATGTRCSSSAGWSGR